MYVFISMSWDLCSSLLCGVVFWNGLHVVNNRSMNQSLFQSGKSGDGAKSVRVCLRENLSASLVQSVAICSPSGCRTVRERSLLLFVAESVRTWC